MPVYCCGHKLTVRKFETAAAHGSVPGFPIKRCHCRDCGRWYCGDGHELLPHTVHWWQRVNEYGTVVKVSACLQGECGEFHETWFRLWRRFAVGPGRTRAEVPAAHRDLLLTWLRTHSGAEARAVRHFLTRWSSPRRLSA